MMLTYSPARQWRTIPDIVIACAAQRPDLAVLADSSGGCVTAATLLERTRQGAYALTARGVRRGQFVAVDTTSLTWAQVAVAYLSVVWLGATAVMVMGAESERVALGQVGVTALITACERELTAGECVPLAELSTAGARAGEPAAAPGDLLDIVFTSGTTGDPKPVTSTHAQWSGLVRPEIMASRARRVVGHTGIPIALSGGLHGVMLSHLARGVTSLRGEAAADLLDGCRARPPAELVLSPYSAKAFAGVLGRGERWADRVTIIRVMGGPVPAAVAEQLADRFPRARVVSLYGLTEGGAALCARVVGPHSNSGSIGRPVGGTEIRVLGPDGRELPRGQIGELAVRVTGRPASAYLDSASPNADSPASQSFRDGWARTGDMGYVAPDGEFRLVGRDLEMIFLRGGRLRPEAVEDILARRMPPDTEFTVVGLPTQGGFDRIAVFIAGDPDNPGMTALAGTLAEMKGPFRPALIRILPELPRGPFGKPLRRQLAMYLGAEGKLLRLADPRRSTYIIRAIRGKLKGGRPMGRSIERIETPAGDPAWQVCGYADVKALLADQRVGRGHPDPGSAPRYSKEDLSGRPAGGSESEYADHARWRRAMTRVFSPSSFERLAPAIRDIAERSVRRLAARKPPVNLNEEFSTPLASEVMCELLGMPTEDIGLFKAWTEEGAQNSDIERAMGGITRLMSYVADVVRRKRENPGDDAVSMLLAAESHPSKVHEGKIVKLVGGMLAFGRETPASVMDWGAMLLLTNPDQRRLLQENPALATGAVEEVLRKFKPPAATDRGLLRYAHTDIDVGGVRIRTGDMLLLDVMTANHDDEIFHDPDKFDIKRDPNPHLTFGHGFYICNFTKLARLEIGTALASLFSELPELQLAEPPTQLQLKDHLRTGGLERLPVTW
ncbi:MAG: cytochrome P450 [Streptosporangiaceae bacterium]|nr:cytochrome P450 [Streptosporangiaceae bacterium]